MRLLSLLSDIETALESDGGARPGVWQCSRMVNFRQGFARLSLAPEHGTGAAAGSIFLQAFTLANGSFCVKAGLSWVGSEECPVLAIYAKSRVDWERAAEEVATAWATGPAPVARRPDLAEALVSAG